MNEAVNKWVCDQCGKVVELPQTGDEDLREGFHPIIPDGWLRLTVYAAMSRVGDLCSKRCAAKWLLKRERRRAKKDEQAP